MIKNSSLEPTYGEPFEFEIGGSSMQDLYLELKVMDRDMPAPHNEIGFVVIGPNAPFQTGQEHWNLVTRDENSVNKKWHSIIPIGE